MRRRGAAGIAILALALAAGSGLAACGGGGSGDDGGAATENEVRDAVTSFFEAGNEHDAETICGLMTEEQATRFEAVGDGSCVDGVELLISRADPPPTELLVEDVRVRGSRATVDATITQGGRTRARSISLIEEDGEWRLTDPGL